MALFGRQPYGIEHLENPSLLPRLATNGSQWLSEIRQKLLRLHKDLQRASDVIKASRVAAANARQRMEVDGRAGAIRASDATTDRYVRIIRGSFQEARYARKHGHGEPWKHRYKVLAVRPHAVKLEVPKDGSVPRINEWQLIRRCEPCPAVEVLPTPDDPVLTESGVPLPGHCDEVVDDEARDDALYPIESILSAEKVGGRFVVWVKWQDHADATKEWATAIQRQISDPELEQQIEDAKARWRAQHSRQADAEEDDDEYHLPQHSTSSSSPAPAPAEASAPSPPPLGRGTRRRASANVPGLPTDAAGLVAHVGMVSAYFPQAVQQCLQFYDSLRHAFDFLVGGAT